MRKGAPVIQVFGLQNDAQLDTKMVTHWSLANRDSTITSSDEGKGLDGAWKQHEDRAPLTELTFRW